MIKLSSWLASWTPWQLLWVFTLVNLINNLDRGIVPGAFDSISKFIQESTGSADTDALLGLLQSCFIIGYSIAAVAFGHLVHSYPPFKLMTLGLVIWVGSCFLSGFSPNYACLAVARVISGVGEASFQCVVPPFIDTNAPTKNRGLWLSIFYLASPVGQALGFAWGGVIGSSSAGWGAAYLLETIPVIIILPLLWMTPYHRHHPPSTAPGHDDNRNLIGSDALAPPAMLEALDAKCTSVPPSDVPDFAPTSGNEIKPTLWAELCTTLKNRLFLLITFGYAGWIGVVLGLSSFGPAFTQGLGMFSGQSEASITIGASIALAGIIGTPLGGWLLDLEVTRRWVRKKAVISKLQPPGSHQQKIETGAAEEDSVKPDPDDESTSTAMLDLKLNVALRQSFIMTLAGSIVIFVGVGLAPYGAAPFMICISVGFLLLLANAAHLSLATMACVPPESRPFAIGLNTLMIHALGDVPSPPIIGFISDVLAPRVCSGPPDNVTCQRSTSGLQGTLALVVLWLFWPCVLWLAAWILVQRRSRLRSQRSSTAFSETTTLRLVPTSPPPSQ